MWYGNVRTTVYFVYWEKKMNKSPDIQYKGSPIQDKMLGLLMPGFEKMFGGGGGTPKQQDLWKVTNYEIPNPQNQTPYTVNNYTPSG